jgi:hypothetical protein
MASSGPVFDEQTQEEQDTRLDVSVLKEMARKALVDSLNAVCMPAVQRLNFMLREELAGRRCEDSGAGSINRRTIRLGHRSCSTKSELTCKSVYNGEAECTL